jgi:sugar lactone lactonase YvrE
MRLAPSRALVDTQGRMAPPAGLPRLVLASLLVLATAAEAGGLSPGVDAFYPEGPTSSGRDILWAEMPLDRIRRFRDGRVSTVATLPGCGPTAVKRTPAGQYWVLCHLGHRVLRLTERFAPDLDLAVDDEGRRIPYPNDGVVDGQGRLYFSSAGPFALEAPPSGFVMIADSGGRVSRLSGPLRYPNGVTLNRRAGSLLVSEHLNRRILELPLQGGRAGPPRVFFDFTEQGVPVPGYPLAGPDGLLITPAGHVVVAEYGAGRVLFVSATGKLLRWQEVPMPFVTNLLLHPSEPDALVVVGAFDNTGPMLGRVMTLPLPRLR